MPCLLQEMASRLCHRYVFLALTLDIYGRFIKISPDDVKKNEDDGGHDEVVGPNGPPAPEDDDAWHLGDHGVISYLQWQVKSH